MLALRELAQGDLLGSRVIPVVESIKITSTFNGALKAYTEKKYPLALILNPAVGELSSGAAISSLLPFINGSVIPSAIMGKNTEEVISALSSKDMTTDSMLAIMTNRDFLDIYLKLFDGLPPPKFTLFSDERRIRHAIKENKTLFSENKILFEDKFKKQEKNADYLKHEDEFYSDDHLYLSEDDFSGFGDYSIIGSEYNEAGFAPYAVAIHIVYFADDNTLRVRHFVSDSNEDISDAAGKFYEAVMKLKRWFDDGQSKQLTTALATLLSHAENGYYPGLPTIKKLSIMHHLELVGKYLGTLDGGSGK